MRYIEKALIYTDSENNVTGLIEMNTDVFIVMNDEDKSTICGVVKEINGIDSIVLYSQFLKQEFEIKVNEIFIIRRSRKVG